MIVTRQRKRRRHLGRYAVPALILVLLAAVLAWPPARRTVAEGPLAPAWNAGASVLAVAARPLSFAAQQEQITDKNRALRELDGRLETQRKAELAADARIAQLQQQLGAQADEPQPSPVPTPVRSAAPAELGGAPGAGPPASGDLKRVAATWAAMEPEKAAALIQRLPEDEVVRVLAQMDADDAAGILNVLPPALAARLSRAGAQVSAAADR